VPKQCTHPSQPVTQPIFLLFEILGHSASPMIGANAALMLAQALL
jgi:hypothetical protein